MKRDDHASWMQAQEYASHLGKIPNVFSAAVRLLVSDHMKHGQVLRPATKYLVGQALRGKKILSMLYHVSSQYKPAAIEDKNYISLGDLIALYQPYDLAVIYSLFLLYRRSLKALDISKEEFKAICPNFEQEVQLGGLVGAAIPRIGIGNGLLSGSVHHLAKLMIAVKHSKAMVEYNFYLNKTGKCWDLQYEVAKFGCTTLQVGSVLLTKLGFNRRFVETYIGALDQDLGLGDLSTGMLYPILYGRIWIDGLLKAQEQPLDSVPGEYYPVVEAATWLRTEAQAIRDGRAAWIEKDANDISETLTPALFSKDQTAKELPQQLQDIFSLKEIASMDENEFDALIDEIDKGLAEGTIDAPPTDCIS